LVTASDGHLALMATALAASALLLGTLAERLRRAGIPTELFLAAMLALSMAAQLALLLGLPLSSHLLFAVVAAAGAATVLSFAVLAQYFPKEVSGRANAALGVLNMGTAFGLQCLSGFIVALWPADGGRYPAEAHQAAVAAGLGLQLIALGVFFTPGRRLKPAPMATLSPGRSVSVKRRCRSLGRSTRHGHTRPSSRGAKEPPGPLPPRPRQLCAWVSLPPC
jgi:MFS family permease